MQAKVRCKDYSQGCVTVFITLLVLILLCIFLTAVNCTYFQGTITCRTLPLTSLCSFMSNLGTVPLMSKLTQPMHRVLARYLRVSPPAPVVYMRVTSLWDALCDGCEHQCFCCTKIVEWLSSGLCVNASCLAAQRSYVRWSYDVKWKIVVVGGTNLELFV